MRVSTIVVSLCLMAQDSTAASLRGKNVSTANHTSLIPDKNVSTANHTDDAKQQTLDAVMSMVGSMQASRSTTAAPSQGNASHRAKIDLGFTGYEQNLTQGMTASIRKMTQDKIWTEPMRQRLIANVTATVIASINNDAKPVKQSVGKTWMALPQDEQKNAYVDQLKSSFSSVFADSLDAVLSHFQRGDRFVESLAKRSKPLPADELIKQSEKKLADVIIAERCFGSEAFLQMESELKNENATSDMQAMFAHAAEEIKANASHGNGTHHQRPKKFCLPNIVSNLVTRLKDAQGLIGMTMRMQAGAMSLVQIKKQTR